MRFRPANIRLINRRSILPRLLLALCSKEETNNDNKNNATDVQRLTGHSISESDPLLPRNAAGQVAGTLGFMHEATQCPLLNPARAKMSAWMNPNMRLAMASKPSFCQNAFISRRIGVVSARSFFVSLRKSCTPVHKSLPAWQIICARPGIVGLAKGEVPPGKPRATKETDRRTTAQFFLDPNSSPACCSAIDYGSAVLTERHTPCEFGRSSADSGGSLRHVSREFAVSSQAERGGSDSPHQVADTPAAHPESGVTLFESPDYSI